MAPFAIKGFLPFFRNILSLTSPPPAAHTPSPTAPSARACLSCCSSCWLARRSYPVQNGVAASPIASGLATTNPSSSPLTSDALCAHPLATDPQLARHTTTLQRIIPTQTLQYSKCSLDEVYFYRSENFSSAMAAIRDVLVSKSRPLSTSQANDQGPTTNDDYLSRPSFSIGQYPNTAFP